MEALKCDLDLLTLSKVIRTGPKMEAMFRMVILFTCSCSATLKKNSKWKSQIFYNGLNSRYILKPEHVLVWTLGDNDEGRLRTCHSA